MMPFRLGRMGGELAPSLGGTGRNFADQNF